MATRSKKRRIGLLCNHLGGATRPHENAVAQALADVAADRDYDLVCLPGRLFRSDSPKAVRERFFGNVAQAACVDGLVIHSSLLQRYIRDLDLDAFRQSLEGIPMVYLGLRLSDEPAVVIDNRDAMRRVIIHLAENHGARRIAFIKGPEDNPEARERLEGYRQGLDERGLNYDPALVFPGEFMKESGDKVAALLFGGRRRDCDAVAAVNDESALGVLRSLGAYGLRCPDDVLVCGFDDIEASRLSLPPLATMKQEIYGMARQAGEALCDLLEGKAIPKLTVVPAIFIPRESCGCKEGKEAEERAANPSGYKVFTVDDATLATLACAIGDKLPELGGRSRAFLAAQSARLANNFGSIFPSGNIEKLSQILAGILDETELGGLDPALWLEPVKAACDALRGPPGNQDRALLVDALLAKLSRSVYDRRADALRRAAHRHDRYDFALAETSQALIGVTNLASLGEILSQHLSDLDIAFCLIILERGNKASSALRPALLCDKTGFKEFPKNPRLSVRGALKKQTAKIQIVETLTLRGEYFGVASFGMDAALGQVTGLLRMHIAGALGSIHNYEEAERKRATIEALNRDYAKQLRRLHALRAIDMAITGGRDENELLAILLEQAAIQLGADAAAILLADERKGHLAYGASRGFRTDALKHSKLRLGEGYAGEAAQSRSIIIVEDLAANTKSFSKSPLLKKEGFAAYCAAPLYARGVLMGVIELFMRRAFSPDDDWKEFLEAVAGQAAIALDNRTLMRGLEKANEDLLSAYDETIEGWSRALDLRDHETQGHSIRVAAQTVELGRRLGLEEKELTLLYRGALLHDIGKVAISDSILLKPGVLTEEEAEKMRDHPRFAYELLYPIAHLRPAIDIPYCHHEKWDGTGYPRGLAGNQIPLSARIFAVIDVWDALISGRPYREAWSEADALSYIRDQAGKHFDPEIVEIFLDIKTHAR